MKIVSKNQLLVGTAILALATGAIYGCSDFLSANAIPQGTLDAGTLANRPGVEGTLVGAYRALDCMNSSPLLGTQWGCAASNWAFASVGGADSYKGSTASDQPWINDLEGYHWGTAKAQEYLNQKWIQMYEGVVRSNATLRLLKAVVASKPGEFTAAEAKAIEGEATFLRAHYHFEAYRLWGKIPYYKEDDTDFRKANEATVAAVETLLLADLDKAISLLPTASRNGDKGRVNQWTAKAYKGRVQVYAGQFAAAVITLKDVRDLGPYGLETSFDRVWSGFADVTNGPETIFAFQASINDGEPNGNNANFGERLNFPNGGHFGCCGFNQPTQNLVNYYRVDAAGLPLALSSPNTWNTNDANFTAADVGVAVDPRLDWTVGREGVPLKDWGLYTVAAYARDLPNGGPYSPKKNIHEQASGAEQTAGGWVPSQLNSVNIHLFRYADLLLMLAEAMVETNDLVGATNMVNLVRNRAAVKVQGPGTDRATTAIAPCTPGPGCSITWATYRVSPYPVPFASQAFGRDAVRAERRLELALEGQRLFDLQRWGIADVTLNPYINGGAGSGGGAEKTRRTYLASAEAVVSKHRWHPIPQIQIELSKVGTESRLKQTDGWGGN
jgi:hypothetical protein